MSDTPQREDGWYWVRVNESPRRIEFIRAGTSDHLHYTEIGPRIPSPEELAELCWDRDALEQIVLRSPAAAIRIDAMSNGDKAWWQIRLIDIDDEKLHEGETLREAIDVALAASKADAEKEYHSPGDRQRFGE